MKKILSSAIIALILFSLHVVIQLAFIYFLNENTGYYGPLGGIVYSFIMTFWIYWILVFALIFFSKEYFLKPLLIKASILAIIGYTVSQFSSILSGDFHDNFSLTYLLTYLPLIPALVGLLVKSKQHLTTK